MRPIGPLVLVQAVLLALIAQLVLPAPATAQRAARLRQATADFLGGAVDSLAGPFAVADAGLDDALLEPIGGGADDLQQSLGSAVSPFPSPGISAMSCMPRSSTTCRSSFRSIGASSRSSSAIRRVGA